MKVTLTFADCTEDEAAYLTSCARGGQAPGFEDREEVRPEDGEDASSPTEGPRIPWHPPAPAPRKRASRAKVVEAPVASAAPVPPAPVTAPVPPPPPPQNFNAAELVETFPQFMLHITPRLASGELTTAKLKLVTDTLGLEGLGSLATQTNLIGRAMDLLK